MLQKKEKIFLDATFNEIKLIYRKIFSNVLDGCDNFWLAIDLSVMLNKK